MVEKVFEKRYELTTPKGTFTRIANRLIKEYEEAHGNYGVPDEVLEIAEKIKSGKMEELEYNYEHTFENGGRKEVCDRSKHVFDDSIFTCIDYDEHNEPYYFVRWYFYDCEIYIKTINGKKIEAYSYHDILVKGLALKGEYRYLCAHRPPASYCIPEGYLSYDAYIPGERYCGEATYNRLLTSEECNDLGLRLDREYTEWRKALLQDEEERKKENNGES